MSRTFTAADRSALIRLAGTMPAGSEERRAILAGLKSASAKLKWEPKHDYWDGTKRVLKRVAQSRDHQWEIRRTGEHPQLGMAHEMKRSWVKVFRDGKQFGKPHGSIRAAQRHVQAWVDEYER